MSQCADVLALEKGFRGMPALSREEELQLSQVLHRALRSPSGTRLKTRGGQGERPLGSGDRNHARDWPKALQRGHKTQVFDLCGFAMYVLKISGMHPGRQTA